MLTLGPSTAGDMPAPNGTHKAHRSLLWSLTVPTCVAVALLVVAIGAYTPHAVMRTAMEDAVLKGQRTAKDLQTLRSFYSEHVVAKATTGGAKASPKYKTDAQAIPVPTTFILDVAQAFSHEGGQVRLVSPYPWPTRSGRALDDFQSEAWEYLKSNPNGLLSRREQIDGHEMLRVAVGDTMQESCVTCHNTHPSSPKTDWKVGDVRGLIEVVQSVDTVLAGAQELSLRLVVGIIVAGLVLLGLLLANGMRLIRPIRDLIATIYGIARGELKGGIPHTERTDELGTVAQALTVLRAHTEERAALQAGLATEAAARRAQVERFDAALNNMSQGLCMYDGSNRLTVSNRRFSEIYGLPQGSVEPGMHLLKVLEAKKAVGNYAGRAAEDVLAECERFIAQGRATVFHEQLAGDRTVCVSQIPMGNGGWVATYEDITERKRSEAQIAHMAHHDALTGLPNRVLFRAAMESALARLCGNEKLAVLCLDLDAFKSVNDTLGHPIGDALLKIVAERLRGCARESDMVARLGGDEFALIGVCTEPAEVSALAQSAIEAISAPCEIEGQQIVIGASIGIGMAPEDGTDPDHLLKKADMALYRAKADGRGVARFFEPEMDERLQARRALEVDLRNALVQGGFELFYQPLVNLKTDAVSGFEALLRWRHPDRGMVLPGDFVPLAEETGLIVPLGEWVLRNACAEAAGWPETVKVAVNLSAVQFKSEGLVPSVISALASSGLPASRLELEITESVLLNNSEAILRVLHQLRGLGVRISMDDFGTGYSSLSYLQSFPFDKIKIDRSFVRDLGEREDSMAIIRAVVGLGDSLGMTTTAEGVETAEQLERLRAEGCTEAQGYLFSPPRPADETRARLALGPKAAAAA